MAANPKKIMFLGIDNDNNDFKDIDNITNFMEYTEIVN